MHLRRVARALLTRRAASRAYVASASRSEKQTTGIVGLDVLDDAKATYEAICEEGRAKNSEHECAARHTGELPRHHPVS